TLIYRKRAEKELDTNYEQRANDFEALAVQILNRFYQIDPRTCIEAIIRRIPAYGNVTWLELAAKAEAKQFFAQQAVQDVLNDIWYGKIKQRESKWKIIFSTIMLWYSGFLEYHKALVEVDDKPRFLDYFHLAFLLLFSYVILCGVFPLYEFQSDICRPTIDSEKQDDDKSSSIKNSKPTTNITIPYGLQKRNQPAIQEYILLIWVTTLLCEEIRQLCSLEAQTTRNAIVNYFKGFWNELDVLAIILFYVGFILRCLPATECFCAARIVWSIDLSIWYIRSLEIFAAIQRLGPKLVMIHEMINDLKFYMVLLIVFIFGFGVSSHSLIYGTKEFTWHLPREILHLSYWQIFGEIDVLSKFENNFHATGYAVFLILVAYMAIVSILLVNLLIAMFSNTFDRLQNDTDRIWKFQRYSLICEYLSRPSIPPPFIFLSHLWRLILKILKQYSKSPWIKKIYVAHLERTQYAISSNDEKLAKKIEKVEDVLGDEVYYNCLRNAGKFNEEHDFDEERVHTPQDSVFKKMQILESQVKMIRDQVTMTRNQQDKVLEYLHCLMDGMKMIGGERIKVPELRPSKSEESIDETTNHNDQSRQSLQQDSIIADIRHSTSTCEFTETPSVKTFRFLKK
ncbi:unnamed protein product, partial [Rotaria sp. Silwood1]